jgi:hypothetical protein
VRSRLVLSGGIGAVLLVAVTTASSQRAVPPASSVVSPGSGVAAAHRLDAYRQAARLDVRRDRLALDIDLTPGTIVAPTIAASIDRNADAAFDAREQAAAAADVAQALDLRIDGARHRLTVTAATFPDAATLQRGEGTIRVRMRADHAIGSGTHRVSLRNGHEPVPSVYAASVVAAEDSRIAIGRQHRSPDHRQLEFDVVFDSPSRRLSTSLALLGIVAVLLLAEGARARQR